MSHPDPHGQADRIPIKVGEVWENPVTGERATILERPWDNPAGRVTAELTALVGARVVGERRHPALVERFTPLEGKLTVKRNGQTSILHQGETAVIDPGVWHDRVPFAAAGRSTHDLLCASTDRALAWLLRDVPAALAHRAGASDVAASVEEDKPRVR